ncbi:MAG: hypothetical protein FWC50_01630 [Planctomycetaceae bacterium]|nr:hypothetical protein [Planctomycetaceae bacterium]
MKGEFDDALRGMYHEYDEVRPQEKDGYRAIGSLSVTAFVFGILSFLAFFSWLLLIFPLLGLIFGGRALQKIIAAPNVMGGLSLTIAGMLLSLFFGGMSLLWHYWSYYNVIPTGYTAVEFTDFAAGRERGTIPEDILALDGQRVFVTGYMFPTKKQSGFSEFALVRTLNPSTYASATPYPTDMILVRLGRDQTTSYRTSPLRVGGILHVNRDYSYENLPYIIDADFVR